MKKPGMPGFLLPSIQVRLLILLTGLGSLGRTQATDFLRIRQQRPVDLKSITRLDRLALWIGNYLAENPHRARGQVELGEFIGNARCSQCSANRRALRHCKCPQDLTLDSGIHHFYLDQRLSSAFCLARWQNASTRVLAA